MVSMSPTSSSRDADALTLLKAQHRDVKTMFQSYQKLVDDEAGDDEREFLASEICDALTVHATIEEEIFYPAARAAIDEADLLDEAEVEHASAKDLIGQIRGMSPSDDLYDAKVKVLGEYIDHHVREEEGEMFPQVEKASMDLDDLGRRLADLTRQLVAELPATA
jgi:hemerythrin superfamily protein